MEERYCFSFAANLNEREFNGIEIEGERPTLESFDHRFDFDENILRKSRDEHD